VFTVKGSFREHMRNRQSWTEQCTGPVTHEFSRLEFSASQVLERGDTLSIYVSASSACGTGIAPSRQQPVSDASMTISSGVVLTGRFEGILKSIYSFVGGVEYIDLNKTMVLDDLGRDLHAYCLSDDMADLTIIVGDSRLAAHGLILAARSSVFRAMLQHPMQESQTREIRVEGVEETTMRAMLRYIYSGTLDDCMFEEYHSCLSLVQAAHQYDLPELVEASMDELTQHMHVGSVSDLLLLADDLSCHSVKQRCLTFIGSHGAEVQDTEGFHRATQRQPLVLEICAAMCPKKASAA